MQKNEKKKAVKFSLDINKVEEMVDKLMESMMDNAPNEKQPFVMGFTINFNSDDLPVIEELKEINEEKGLEKELAAVNFSRPLAEAHYFRDEIIVSFELPKKISKKELKVNVKENSVVVKSLKHNFFRRLCLKHKINPKNFSSNFNNSFLELAFKKK